MAALATRRLARRAQSFIWAAAELLPAADIAARLGEAPDDPPQQSHESLPMTAASSRFPWHEAMDDRDCVAVAARHQGERSQVPRHTALGRFHAWQAARYRIDQRRLWGVAALA